jgi:hypothetical protein
MTAAAFHRGRRQDYELSILAGMDSFAYTIRDRTRNELLAYRSHRLEAGESDDWEGVIDTYLRSDHRLSGAATYGRCVLAWNGAEITLVPAPLFDDGDPGAYLESLTVIGLQDTVRTYHSAVQDGTFVYAVGQERLTMLEQFLQPTHTVPYAAGLLDGWSKRSERLGQERVSCAIRCDHLFVAGHSHGALRYFNRFPYRTAADVTYFVLLAYSQSAFATDRIGLYLSGDITEQGEIFGELRRYVADIQFGVPPRSPKIPPELSQVRTHQIYDLLCLS